MYRPEIIDLRNASESQMQIEVAKAIHREGLVNVDLTIPAQRIIADQVRILQGFPIVGGCDVTLRERYNTSEDVLMEDFDG